MAKAREAALEVKASVAVPDFGETRGRDQTDFNDLLRLKGLEAVRTCVENNRLTTEEVGRETDLAVLAELAGNWEAEPEPVLPQKKASPPFPLESLPPIIREAVTETLDYTQVPVGLACSTGPGCCRGLSSAPRKGGEGPTDRGACVALHPEHPPLW